MASIWLIKSTIVFQKRKKIGGQNERSTKLLLVLLMREKKRHRRRRIKRKRAEKRSVQLLLGHRIVHLFSPSPRQIAERHQRNQIDQEQTAQECGKLREIDTSSISWLNSGTLIQNTLSTLNSYKNNTPINLPNSIYEAHLQPIGLICCRKQMAFAEA